MNCTNEQDLKKFLAGDGVEAEREAVETHLADCSECRFRLSDLYTEKNKDVFYVPAKLKEEAKALPGKAEKTESVGSFLWKWQTGFATLGFVILFGFIGFFVWNGGESQNDGGDDVLRQGRQNLDSLKLLSPKDNANINVAKIDFDWEKAEDLSVYTLIISDEKGDIVFEKQTKDEGMSVTDSESKLVAEKYYFWHVRAKFIDGRIAESASRKFTFKN